MIDPNAIFALKFATVAVIIFLLLMAGVEYVNYNPKLLESAEQYQVGQM